jgi:arginase family enzyme
MEYTHGSFAIRAIEEGLIAPNASTQVAPRGMLFGPEDIERSDTSGLRAITAEEMATRTIAEVARDVRDRAGDRPVYVTFDIDGVDPVFASGTGTPEVGGPTRRDATMFLQGLAGVRLIGADVVEVASAYDQSGNTALLAARLGLKLLGLMAIRDRPARQRAGRSNVSFAVEPAIILSGRMIEDGGSTIRWMSLRGSSRSV